MGVVEAFEALVAAHDEMGSPLRAALRPGLDPAWVEAELIARVGRSHPDLVELYAWHDGTDPIPGNWDAELLPYGCLFPPFSWAAEVQSHGLEEVEYAGEDRPWWRASWWPALKLSGANFLAVDTPDGRLWESSIQMCAGNLLFESLTEFLEAGAWAVRERFFYFDPGHANRRPSMRPSSEEWDPIDWLADVAVPGDAPD